MRPANEDIARRNRVYCRFELAVGASRRGAHTECEAGSAPLLPEAGSLDQLITGLIVTVFGAVMPDPPDAALRA